MLRSYLRRVRRAGWMGAVHVEVPFGKKHGGGARRLDAVRFPQLENRIRLHRRDAFLDDLPGRAGIELIEVKPKLDRPVIGQLVAARHLVHAEWGLRPSRALRLVAVVVETDEALARVCRRLGIRVEQVRYPTRQLERARATRTD
jgi:hypothetical protein